ncbi:hypothetical protein GEMRC1_012384 [Eukaryota sp. GEM-RC1]
MSSSILLLGSANSGKSLLVESLKYFLRHNQVPSISDCPRCRSTVGRESYTLHSNAISINITELGSSILSLWMDFSSNFSKFLFIVDDLSFDTSVFDCLSFLQGLSSMPNSFSFSVLVLLNGFGCDVTHWDPLNIVIERFRLCFYSFHVRTFSNDSTCFNGLIDWMTS